MLLSLVLRPEIQIMCSTTAQCFKNEKKNISGDGENCLELVLHQLGLKIKTKQIICSITQTKHSAIDGKGD